MTWTVYNGLICETLLTMDRNAQPVDKTCIYQVPETFDDDKDGTVDRTVYTFAIREEVTFSNGKKPTADDIIFAIKVFMDSNYDGRHALYSLPIVGAQEYRYDDPNYAAKLEEIDKQVQAFQPEDASEELIASCAQALSDTYGVALEDVMPGGQYYETETVNYLPEAYRDSLMEAYVKESLAQGGNRVQEITGVEKVDESTVEITLNGVDPAAIWTLGLLPLVPASHYGGESFQKGDLSGVKAQDKAPMGTGPYRFISYENNVVSLEANPDYWDGAPKNAKVKFQVVDEVNKLQNIQLGNCDISDPSASQENVKAVE